MGCRDVWDGEAGTSKTGLQGTWDVNDYCKKSEVNAISVTFLLNMFWWRQPTLPSLGFLHACLRSEDSASPLPHPTRPRVPFLMSSSPSSRVLKSQVPTHASWCPHPLVPVPLLYTTFVHCLSHRIAKTRKDTVWARWLVRSFQLYRLILTVITHFL